MPVAKLKAFNTTDVVKAEEENESVDTLIEQSIGKEPLLSFSRNGDSSVQLIQLLQALDQQELPGWPLLSTMKIQLQKCDKCSRELCSTINYRRHIRVHHRLKKLDKDSAKNRDLLGAFWDKLSVNEAKEVVSFNDVNLEGVTGSSIIKSLTAVIRKPIYVSLPQLCVRAGSALLDIVQARPSRFPISSQELFSILDDASEKTFLSGTAASMQKYIFDGEAGKSGLETRNLVACTSFLVEQILVKAWLADKDAEALRCQKLLVEEEAAQRRQAELLERKRQKKLRQKEQKGKEQRHGERVDDNESTDGTAESVPPPETSSPLATSDSDKQNADVLPDHVRSSLEPFQLANSDEDLDHEVRAGSGNGYADLGPGQNIERWMVQGSGRPQKVVIQHYLPPKSQGMLNGFHPSKNSQASSKLGGVQKHGNYRNVRASPVIGGNKVWSQKPKPKNDYGNLKPRVLNEAINQPQQDKNHEVLIGSISVTLAHCNHHDGSSVAEAQDDCIEEHRMPKKNYFTEKPIQSVTDKSNVKCWRPVSQHGTKVPAPVQNGCRETEMDVNSGQAIDQTLSSESHLRLSMDDYNDGPGSSTSLMEDSMCPGSMQFDCHAAKAFLSERWKDAISAEHVKLILPPDSESVRDQEFESNCQVTVMQSSDSYKWLANGGSQIFNSNRSFS